MNYDSRSNIHYATATNTKGAQFIIKNLSDNYAKAEKEAIAVCKRDGLIFGSLRTPPNKRDTSTVLTKYAKARKALRGTKGYKETH
jgi:hypothetical protein